MWIYLTPSQFDTRGEEAAGILTFGGVKARGLKEKKTSKKAQNQTVTPLDLIFIPISLVVLPVVDPVRKVIVVSYTRVSGCRPVVQLQREQWSGTNSN